MIGLKIALLVALFATAFACGALPLRRANGHHGPGRLLGWGNAFAAGVFLGAGFVHILPDANAEPAHASGELRRDRLARLERELIAPAAENLLHGSVRLDEIFAGQDGRQGSRCSARTSPSGPET